MMHELVNWQGKTEDMQIAYDVGINNRALLPDSFESSDLPVIYSSENDNICDVIEESWDGAVKKADKIDYARLEKSSGRGIYKEVRNRAQYFL